MCMRNKTIVDVTAIFKFVVFLRADIKTVDKREIYNSKGMNITIILLSSIRNNKYSTNNDGAK